MMLNICRSKIVNSQYAFTGERSLNIKSKFSCCDAIAVEKGCIITEIVI